MALGSDKTRLLVNIPIELKKQAEIAAEKQTRSLSNYVVNLIKQDIEKITEKETE